METTIKTTERNLLLVSIGMEREFLGDSPKNMERLTLNELNENEIKEIKKEIINFQMENLCVETFEELIDEEYIPNSINSLEELIEKVELKVIDDNFIHIDMLFGIDREYLVFKESLTKVKWVKNGKIAHEVEVKGTWKEVDTDFLKAMYDGEDHAALVRYGINDFYDYLDFVEIFSIEIKIN